MASVREYAILYVRGTRTGGVVVGGGNAVLTTAQHALDGPEHTATSDQTDLDASTSAHGLLPKLSGKQWETLHGDGAFADFETPFDHGNMGAAETIDLANGTWHRGTLDADCTITVQGFGVDEGVVALIEIAQDGTGGHAITWDADVAFIGDDQPDTTASTVTVFLLFSSAGDSTIYAAKVGQPGLTSADFATPAFTFGTAAAAGAADTVVRSDATLAVFDATAPTTSAVGDAAATGSAGVTARRDHRHGRESFATPGNSAVGDAASAGAATTVPRSDHQHGREAFATPGSSAVGDSASAGVATTVPRSDHRHGREAFGSPVAVGSANADGSATTVPRSDHVHQGASGANDHLHIVGEQLTGDGATTAFMLANEAIPNTVAAYVAGDRTDITLGGMNDQITFGAAPSAAAAIRVDYIPLQT